jgi:hypothetical protein
MASTQLCGDAQGSSGADCTLPHHSLGTKHACNINSSRQPNTYSISVACIARYNRDDNDIVSAANTVLSKSTGSAAEVVHSVNFML